MPGFVYYIPDRGRTVTADELAAAGLGYAFDLRRKRWAPREVARGPVQGLPGGVVVGNPDTTPEPAIALKVDQQVWRKIPKSNAWVGFYSDRRPTPEDLVRGDALRGHSVELGDGSRYEIPVARGLRDDDGELRYFVALPEATGVADDGTWTNDGVDARYQALWEVAESWWDAKNGAAIAEDDGDRVRMAFDFDGLNDAALLALSTNYRIHKAEVAALGLFNVKAAAAILDAVIDWPTAIEWFKKKADAEPDG